MMPRDASSAREHVERLAGAADHRERVLLGDGDGVGLGGRHVVAGARAGVHLDVDRAAVGLEQLVVQVGEALDGLGGRLGVHVGARVLDGRGGQRVERRVGSVEHDGDRVGGHAGRRRAAVVALERLDARGRVHRLEHDAAEIGVAVRPEVDVLAEQLGLLPRHGARADQVLLRRGLGAAARAAAVVVVASAAAEDHDGAGDERHDGHDRPVALERPSSTVAAGVRPRSSSCRRSWSSTAPFVVRRPARGRVSRLSVHRIG